METISGIFGQLIEVWKEMWEIAKPMIGTAFSFSLWVLTAVLVLPCVYIAGNIYPMWEKWGEKF